MIMKNDPNARAYIRLLNASAETSLDILVNAKPYVCNLGYKQYTKYLSALEGTYNFQIFKNGTEILERRVELEQDITYTVVIMGGKDSLSLELVLDEMRPVPKDKSFIRLINTSPSETGLNIMINGEKKLFDLEYGENGDYLELEPGEYELEATCSLSGEPRFIIPKSSFLGGKRYSAYIWPV